MELRSARDNSEFDWISSGCLPLLGRDDPRWEGNTVAHCIPPIFESYAKVLHPIYIDPEDAASTSSWAEVDAANPDPGELISGARLVTVGTGLNAPGPRIRWHAVAAEVGATLVPEINVSTLLKARPDGSMPRRYLGPDEGSLDQPTCSALVAAIAGAMPEESCWYHYVNIATRDIEALTLREPLGSVSTTFESDQVYGTPSYWWPDSRDWCVCTDWDLTFTLVGGPARLVQAVLGAPEIEALEVSSRTRVDWSSGDVGV
jgi:hypothetical protein